MQRRRDIDIEAEIGKSAEQQATLCARHPLRVERAIECSRLAPPRARRIDRIHLERPVAVGGEVDAAFAPARGFVAPVAVGQIADPAGGEIEREQIMCAGPAEGGAIGRKDDGPPVRADGRIEIFVPIRGKALEAPGTQRVTGIGEPQPVEIRIAGLRQAAEHDTLAVRRPGRGENRDELGELIAADDLAFLQVPEKQRVALGVLAAEGRDAVRVHVDPRLEEVERFELLVALALHYLPPASPAEGLRVDRGIATRG